MAIDPATAKIIAQAAAKAATSESGKKVIGGIIIGAIVLLLIILAIPVYILSHPLQALGDLFGVGTPAYNAVETFKRDYDYLYPELRDGEDSDCVLLDDLHESTSMTEIHD